MGVRGRMANVDDVAAAILERQGPMSTWKLQKLVYYCQAWHLVWEDTPLFSDPIEAWANGPVVRSLYSQHRGFFSLSHWRYGKSENLTAGESSTVDAVLKTYGHMSPADLSALTHREIPWILARTGLAEGERGNSRISLESMSEYYAGLL